mgnify:CR=1 FL=1
MKQISNDSTQKYQQYRRKNKKVILGSSQGHINAKVGSVLSANNNNSATSGHEGNFATGRPPKNAELTVHSQSRQVDALV